MPPKTQMSSFGEGKRFDRAVQQSRRDMANLRKKFGDKKVDENRPDRHLDDFTKQPIAAVVRAIIRRTRK